jgi:APA family basic amino acid/polyamine antiporter
MRALMSLGELRRVLGPATGVAVCCGMAVGAGILRVPGEVARLLPGEGWIYGAWCLGALIATLDAFILAEMAAMVPRAGGLVAYVQLSFGPAAAFLVGWSMLLVTWPASLAFVAVASGQLVTGGAETLVAGADPTGLDRLVAVALIAGIGALNLTGLRSGARFEVATVLLKMLLLAGVCVAAAFVAPRAAATAPAAPLPSDVWPLVAALGTAMLAVVFTYDGYADAVYLAGETRDPGRTLPRVLLTALLSITGLYLLANVTFVRVLGVEGLAASTFPALDVARAAFGPAGGAMLTGIALVVLASAINGYFLTGPRIGRLLAEEGLATELLGRVPASGAPLFGTLWIMAVSIAFALTNTFDELLAITVPIITATTVLVAVGLLLQRVRAPDRPRPFRVRCAPLVVGLQIAIGLALLASFAAAQPRALAVDAGALALGLGVHAALARAGARTRHEDGASGPPR